MMKNLSILSTLLVAVATTHPVVEEAPLKLEALDGHLSTRQTCSGPVASNPTTWWRAAIGHNGTTPMSTDSTYQYYRTATTYGADNTGVNDAADAFNFAITGRIHTWLGVKTGPLTMDSLEPNW
jgi:hypothetical protein